MSDLMLYGVLRMPYDMAMSSELSRRQFYDRVQEAADRLQRAEAASPAAAVPEGALPPLPEPDHYDTMMRRSTWSESLVRQAQRDAVEADRAQQGEPVAWACGLGLDFKPMEKPDVDWGAECTWHPDYEPFPLYRAATKAAAPAEAPKVSLAYLLELVEQAEALPDLTSHAPIPLTPIQIAYVAGKLADLRAAPAPDTGIPNAGELLDNDALVDAAHGYATAYDDDSRDCIKTDVLNAFYAGSEWASRRAPVSSTPTSGAAILYTNSRELADVLQEGGGILTVDGTAGKYFDTILAAKAGETGNA